MRSPCPHCGGSLLGIGWGAGGDGKDWCSVICRKCSARGPSCATEEEAWDGWNGRTCPVDENKLDAHVRLCFRNLNTEGIKRCTRCPFEDIIVARHPNMRTLFFWAKRGVSVAKMLKEAGAKDGIEKYRPVRRDRRNKARVR